MPPPVRAPRRAGQQMNKMIVDEVNGVQEAVSHQRKKGLHSQNVSGTTVHSSV